MDAHSDEAAALLARARAADQAALSELFTRHRDRLRRMVEMRLDWRLRARIDASDVIQDAYLDGRKDDAAAAVPTSMVEDIALVGPVDKIRDDLEAWRESRATTMLVNGDLATMRTMAELVLG